ncbi:unnamed protein product [Danaus chrysippus]|uniref:(African queen) hypothetical protein n=1 Tax=Danaus chrysippus TaxID=151541 RepID=A0A8J2R7J5_9NEOP|nr:unnamed protein product [Danaus chrysippus]
MTVEEATKPIRSKFQRHTNALIWKSYLQRQRRWRLLSVETLLAILLYLCAILVAKPVFLTPLQAIPQPPLTSADILASLNKKNILGYAPNIQPFNDIMNTVGDSLETEIISAPKEDDLNNILYNRSRGVRLNNPVIWIIWKRTENNMWKFSIRSTERAQYATGKKISSSPHLRSGVLAVQLAISQAIVQYASGTTPVYQLSLASMPVSPLMEHERVRKHISSILLCFTLALLAPVLETQSLVIYETSHKFKRALRIRGVDYSSMYIGWLTYFYLTALPICLLASITLILIFRWVHLLFTFILVLAYVSVMVMLALIMAMFHTQTIVAATWTTLFTLLQTFLAELIVHHGVDLKHEILTFFLHLIIPPLGLMHGFNEFALLQTGHEGRWEGNSLVYTILFWFIMIALYFGILMMLQRTLKTGAIGGQVSWKSIIFKSAEDFSKLHQIKNPTGREHEKLQEVDELTAKAISIRNMSKSIMGNSLLSNITLDIYRGEFTMLYSEFIQSKMIQTMEDLLMGLTDPDEGSINILGEELTHGKMFVSVPHMLGYCHRKGCLIDDLTVQEHFTFYCSICLWNESSDYVSEYEHLRSIRLLAECELQSVCHEYVRNLGVYYQAQLCWAIAMLLEPRIIIIPSFGYDSAFNSVMRDKIMASREYRVRLTLKSGSFSNDEDVNELLKRTAEAGATIRAHLGTLLILRLPASPTANVAALVKDLSENTDKYEIVSMNISIPDSEEVCNRAIFESRANIHGSEEHHQRIKTALTHLAEAAPIKRNKSYMGNFTHLRYTWAKFVAYYRHYRLYFFITALLAITSGIFIGISLATVLGEIERDRATKAILHGEVLTVEALEQKTNLILRADNSSESKSVVNAYVFSETMATEKQIENMFYTALAAPESITEYLVTRAIDSPQQYVFLYAYGLDVAEVNGSLRVRVLYSPLHTDHSAAPRALARAFMALLRHYTSALDATIQVTDDPLALDLTTCHAKDFSPARYWLTLFICDIILCSFLVILMTAAMIAVMIFVAPMTFRYTDLAKSMRKSDTHLLALNVSQRHYEKSMIRNVYLSLSKGEVLAISGVLEHGRLRLCEILAGYQLPTDGKLWSLSKWTVLQNPHLYSQQTSLNCEHEPLPGWMSVKNALEMLAVLRGVPRSKALDLVSDYIDAMELYHQADRQICYLKAKDRARLRFAAAVIGAPEVVILEESTEYQKFSVRRAMYHILNSLRQRGHSIIISSSSVETLLPVSNRLAILVNGRIYDIDQLDKLVERHSDKGYTVVVQLKQETNVAKIFARYFTNFIINDASEKLVNFQLLDEDLTYTSIFEKMEIIQEENDVVNSYIVSATPIDYIYNSIINQERGHIAEDQESRLTKYFFRHKKQITPPKTDINKLIPFETRFHLTKLKELPWSVIFDK